MYNTKEILHDELLEIARADYLHEDIMSSFVKASSHLEWEVFDNEVFAALVFNDTEFGVVPMKLAELNECEYHIDIRYFEIAYEVYLEEEVIEA